MQKKLKTKTLPGLIELFRISNQTDGKSPKTTEWYDETLKSFLAYLGKEKLGFDLSTFNIEAVRTYIHYLRSRNKFSKPAKTEKPSQLSPKTVQCHVRALKAFASWLYRDDYTKENLLRNLKIPHAPQKMIEPLTADEIKKNLKVVNRKTPNGKRNYAIVTLMLDTGLRVSEVSSSKLGEVNLDKSCLKILGKGNKERLVPIGDYCRMMITDYIENGRPKPTNRDVDNLFLSDDGGPLSSNAIKLLFSRIKKLSGVTRLHPHLLRHTFATNYLLNGGDVFTLKAILGHSSLEMVNHYLHFTSAQLAIQHHKFSPMDKLQGK